MFDIALRRMKDQCVEPICRYLPSQLSPNLFTAFAFIFGLAACYSAATSERRLLSVSLWLLNRLFDCLDGSLARVHGSTSEVGGFLDLLSDFVIYSILPISVAFGQDSKLLKPDWRAVAMLEASFHINNFVLFYVAAVTSKTGADELTSVSMQPALIEGFESGLLFTFMLLWPSWITSISLVMSAAVAIGVVQRVAILVPILKHLDIKLSTRKSRKD